MTSNLVIWNKIDCHGGGPFYTRSLEILKECTQRFAPKLIVPWSNPHNKIVMRTVIIFYRAIHNRGETFELFVLMH